MASINTLGVDALSIRGASGEYHRLNRFFRSRAEAEAALEAAKLENEQYENTMKFLAEY